MLKFFGFYASEPEIIREENSLYNFLAKRVVYEMISYEEAREVTGIGKLGIGKAIESKQQRKRYIPLFTTLHIIFIHKTFMKCHL